MSSIWFSDKPTLPKKIYYSSPRHHIYLDQGHYCSWTNGDGKYNAVKIVFWKWRYSLGHNSMKTLSRVTTLHLQVVVYFTKKNIWGTCNDQFMTCSWIGFFKSLLQLFENINNFMWTQGHTYIGVSRPSFKCKLRSSNRRTDRNC